MKPGTVQTATNQASTYSCYVGTHTVDLSECNIYGPVFNSANRASGNAYGDPRTGAAIAGQTSPSAVDEVTGKLLTRAPIETNAFVALADKPATMRLIASQCLQRVGLPSSASPQPGQSPIVPLSKDKCESMPIFAPGLIDIKEASEHDADAIASGQPAVLHFVSSADKNSGPYSLPSSWTTRVEYANCGPGKVPGETQCDEYPYYSTAEGGPGASLRNIRKEDNSKEGGLLSYFYTRCGLVSSAAPNEYLVVPIAANTVGVCSQ